MDFRSLIPFGRSSAAAGGLNEDPFRAIRREMDRMFDEFARGWPADAGQGYLSPKLNVAETADGLEVTAELPGIDQRDIDLDLSDGVLTLKASHKVETKKTDEAKHYHLVERSAGTFLRRFTLPFEADTDKVEARFEKGVLTVTIPRSATPDKPMHKIEIKAA